MTWKVWLITLAVAHSSYESQVLISAFGTDVSGKGLSKGEAQ